MCVSIDQVFGAVLYGLRCWVIGWVDLECANVIQFVLDRYILCVLTAVHSHSTLHCLTTQNVCVCPGLPLAVLRAPNV